MSVSGGSSTADYSYNGLGDRLQQTVGSTATDYVMDINAGLTQVLSDGTNTYTYGLARISQVGTEDTEYFLGDALGSVRQLTDATGAVTLAKDYGPFGDVVSSLGTTSTTYGFTAEQTDSSTGLVYLRARYYSPYQGRFHSRDIWGGEANSPMSYNDWLYVYGNPINLSDPKGLYGRGLARLIDGDAQGEPEDDPYVRTEYNKYNFFWADEAKIIDDALWKVAQAYANAYQQIYLKQLLCIYQRAPYLLRHIKIQPMDPISVFLRVHNGPVTFKKLLMRNGDTLGEYTDAKEVRIYSYGRLQGTDSYFNGYAYPLRSEIWGRFIVHEMGHVFDNALGLKPRTELSKIENGEYIYNSLLQEIGVNDNSNLNGFAGGRDITGWQRRCNTCNRGGLEYEVFADMFLGWVYNSWEPGNYRGLSETGRGRADFMNTNMPLWIWSKLGNPISINEDYWR